MTITELMELMPGAFLPEKAAGVDAVIQFNFSGDQEGDWFVTIKDGACAVESGVAEDPKMTMAVDGQDYLDIVGGKLDAMGAFMQGKVKVSGDLNLAMKLTSMFKTP